jgi:Uri superfamily endonuclease
MENVKGVYILIALVAKRFNVNVGALDRLSFEKGTYAYVGSAQSNLERRVTRHLKKNKRKFWHIDYLLHNDNAKIAGIFYLTAGESKECWVAKELGKRGFLIDGFGSSDCNCRSHLFKLENCEFLRETMHELAI